MPGAAIAAKRGKVNTDSNKTTDRTCQFSIIRQMQVGEIRTFAKFSAQVPILVILMAAHYLTAHDPATLFERDLRLHWGWSADDVRFWLDPLARNGLLVKGLADSWRVSTLMLALPGRA